MSKEASPVVSAKSIPSLPPPASCSRIPDETFYFGIGCRDCPNRINVEVDNLPLEDRGAFFLYLSKVSSMSFRKNTGSRISSGSRTVDEPCSRDKDAECPKRPIIAETLTILNKTYGIELSLPKLED